MTAMITCKHCGQVFTNLSTFYASLYENLVANVQDHTERCEHERVL